MEERRDEGAEELADQLEQDAQRMQRDREELDSNIQGAKRDWDSRQSDQSMPGAQGEEDLPDEMTHRDSDEVEALATGGDEDDDAEAHDAQADDENDGSAQDASDE